MIVWVDAQLSPALAPWLTQTFGVEAFSARYLTLVRAKDRDIFQAAREANAVVLTKDGDFVVLQERFGPPPAILWVRCGNTSNAYLKRVLERTFRSAQRMIEAGEPLVESPMCRNAPLWYAATWPSASSVECGSDASSAAAFHRRSVELRPWVGGPKGRQLDAAALQIK